MTFTPEQMVQELLKRKLYSEATDLVIAMRNLERAKNVLGYHLDKESKDGK